MSRFINERLNSLEEYVPGEQPQDKKYIKLNTNESPYPPSKEVYRAICNKEIGNLKLYCDPDCYELKSVMANLFNVENKNIFLSNGSDDILNFAFMAYSQNGVVYPDITYGFYNVFAEFHGAESEIIPLTDDFKIDISEYKNKRKMVVIANPNAPTGITLNLDEIEEIVKSNPDGIVLIDEAYIDFGGESCYKLTDKYENLLCVGTFSKSRSLAGGRLGFAIANEKLISDLEKIKYSTNPYNINRLTQKAGIATIKNNNYYLKCCRKIIKTREWVTLELEKLGFYVLPSKANFVFAKTDALSGLKLYEILKKNGILIRHFEKERIKDFNRITIGTDKQMEILIKKIKEIL